MRGRNAHVRVPALDCILLAHLHVRPGHSNCSPFLALPPRTSVLSNSESATRSIVYVHFDPPAGFDCCELIEQPINIGSSATEIAPSPIVVSPSMECCVLPIELCEKVMDALPVYIELLDDGWFLAPQDAMETQQALCACTLTCRAWRVRAQYLLWTFPVLFDSQRFARFNTAVQKSPNTHIMCGLQLGRCFQDKETPDLSTAGELFMHSFPHLRSLWCDQIRFDRGPPLRVLRMRLPFFDSITSLALVDCTFQSLRSMLDVVWACSNLATLVVREIDVQSKRCSLAAFQNLSTAVENLRACRKLTRLWLDMDTIRVSPSFYYKFLDGSQPTICIGTLEPH